MAHIGDRRHRERYSEQVQIPEPPVGVQGVTLFIYYLSLLATLSIMTS